jgi:hypothetical protein
VETPRVPPAAAATGAPPAIKAPVPATIAPSGTAAGDGLIANIERILQRDGATAGASDQPVAGAVAPVDPALAGDQPLPVPVPDPDGPVLLDPTSPPVDVGAMSPPPRLLPPANIPDPQPVPLQ